MGKGHGFKADIIKDEDYIFGAKKLPDDILQSNGNWDNFLPADEEQERNGLETMNCTNYGTLNCLETLLKRLYGGDYNFSERYTGVMTGTSEDGNTPQTVIEIIRKVCGLIPESKLPFSQTIELWNEYYNPKPMTKKYIKEGEKFLNEYGIGHEWVFTKCGKNNQLMLMKALQCSPLGVSVYAWQQGPDGLYIKPEGEPDNHWVCLYGFEEGKFWKVFDSYDNTYKKLVWNYDFGFAKRYYLEEVKKKESLWEKVKKYLEEVLEKIAKIKGD